MYAEHNKYVTHLTELSCTIPTWLGEAGWGGDKWVSDLQDNDLACKN